MFCDCLCSIFEALASLCNPVRPVISLGRIVEQSRPVAPTPEFKGPRPRKRSLLMTFEMSASQETVMSVSFLDKKGNPAQVDTAPEWSTDNTDVLALAPTADGMSCKVSAVGPLGSAKVTVKADADLGEGVTPIIGFVDITIGAGSATIVEINPGTPTEQP